MPKGHVELQNDDALYPLSYHFENSTLIVDGPSQAINLIKGATVQVTLEDGKKMVGFGVTGELTIFSLWLDVPQTVTFGTNPETSWCDLQR